MKDRRTFLELAAAASLRPFGVEAQTPVTAAPAAQAPAGPRPGGELARHALTGPFEGYDVILAEAPMRHFPGPSTPAHRHSSFVLAYVLEGQVRFAIDHEPERIVPAGGTFFEPIGALHTTSGSVSPEVQTRILIFSVVPNGAGLAGASSVNNP
jgi:hypothetical protein